MTKLIAVSLSIVFLSFATGWAQNTVTFDNQSGESALVKLVGPTQKEVEVPNGARVSTDASAGRYIIKARYGSLGQYRYSKGAEFDVKETSTARSEITITLHKVVAGNYDSRPISAEEFAKGTRQAIKGIPQPSPASEAATDLPELWQRDWREFGKRLQDDYSNKQSGTVFEGHAVQWTGTRSQAGAANWIELRMEPFKINFGDGDSITVSSVTLYPTEEELVQWRSVALGQQVVFRTKFRSGKSAEGLGPITFLKMSGKWQLLWGVEGAKLVSQMPLAEPSPDFGQVVAVTGVIRSHEGQMEIESLRGMLTLRWLTLEVAGADPKSKIEYQLEGSEIIPQKTLQDLTNKTVKVTGRTFKSNFSGCKAAIKVDSVTLTGAK